MSASAAVMGGSSSRKARVLLWVHAVLFGLIALACYLSPETGFGAAAWLPLARLAVLLLAAALTATTVVLIGTARSGSPQQVRLVLLASLIIDAQVPILMFSQPASLEYMQAEVGLPWFLFPLLFLILFGVSVHRYLRLRGEGAA